MSDGRSTQSYDMKSKVDDATLMCLLRAKMYIVQQEQVRKTVKLR